MEQSESYPEFYAKAKAQISAQWTYADERAAGRSHRAAVAVARAESRSVLARTLEECAPS